MSETSPTEQVDENNGSANADLPENTSTDQSADEQQTESVSSDSQSTDQNDNNQPDNQTTDDDSSSSDDDGLNNFAKAQGFDPDNLTDGERKALKLAHDNQIAFRKKSQQESDELKNTLEDTEKVSDDELEELDPQEAWQREQNSRMAQLEASQTANSFFNKNPDAREYETDMAKIIASEAEKNGKDAARYLAKDLNRVLILAKADRGESSKEAGAREERERARKRTEGSADGGQATNTHTAPKKLSRADILDMDDGDYQKLRDSGELDAIIDRGDLYQIVVSLT